MRNDESGVRAPGIDSVATISAAVALAGLGKLLFSRLSFPLLTETVAPASISFCVIRIDLDGLLILLNGLIVLFRSGECVSPQL